MRHVMKINKLLLLTILGVFTMGTSVFAKKVVFESSKLKIDNTSGITQTLEDTKYAFLSTAKVENRGFSQANVYNIVEIWLDYGDNQNFIDEFTYSATVDINFESLNSNSIGFSTIATFTEVVNLQITKGNGGFKDRIVIKVPNGGNKFTVTLKNITASSPFAPNLYMQSRIEMDRYYDFNISPVLDGDFSQIDETVDKGTINVNWSEIEYAEWYDFEWTFINNYKEENNVFLASNEIPLEGNFFQNNSTRVSIEDANYNIPMLYESGYLIYRLRAVGYAYNPIDGTKKFVQGPWSIGETATSVSVIETTYPNQLYLFSGHNDDKPWQSSVVFAEEGKNKASVSYFDGTLRNRQSVVKNNSDNEVIVGETIYDFQGRPTVNILPVPGGDEKVDFNPDFNLVTDSVNRPFNRYHFDMDPTTTNDCDPSALGLSTSSGAGKYYSDQNDDQSGFNAYLPDAEKFPFTQVQYENDNTGRIKRQSGVGIDHKLGSGHEVKYFYDVPSQDDLYRLFGYEVGSAERYRRQTVIDANGQATVSYLDPQGRVIATAFKGTTPDNVQQLNSSNRPDKVIIDLIGPGSASEADISIKGGSRNLSKQLSLIDTDIERKFNYDLTIPKYNRIDECDGGSPITNCYNCVLDLEISLKDDCGDSYTGGDTTFTEQLEADAECSEKPFSKEFVMGKDDYKQGSIGITKKLTINEDKLDEYWQSYLNNPLNCVKTKQDFFNAQFALLDTDNCSYDCDDCKTALVAEFGDLIASDHNSGDSPDSYPNPYNTVLNSANFLSSTLSDNEKQRYGEYLAAIKACNALCDESNRCVTALTSMIMDMAPGGQYGLIEKGGPTEESTGLGLNEEGLVDNSFDPGKDFESLADLSAEDLVEYLKQFPLSIFNLSNILPKYESGQNNLFNKTEPIWKNPKGILRNEEGVASFVEVVLQEDGVTIIPALASNVSLNSSVPGSYNVRPQFLKNVKDFLRVWEPSWAINYVHMHPEFPFYIECLKFKESYKYDERLREIGWASAVTDGYLEIDGNVTINAVSKPLIYAQDPILNVAGFSGVLETSLQILVQNDGVFNRDIAEMAHMIIDCPNSMANTTSRDKCGEPCDENPLINNDDKWLAYSALYNTKKESMLKIYYEVVSKEKGFYNGCIGNNHYNYMDYLLAGNPAYSDASTPQEYFFGGLGNAFFDKKNPCGMFNYSFYQNKSARFPLSMPNFIQGHDAEYCVPNDDVMSQFNASEFTCLPAIEAENKELTKKIQFNVFKDCGLCPLGKELESFLNAFFNQSEAALDDPVFPLACGGLTSPILSKTLAVGMGLDDSQEANLVITNSALNTDNRYVYSGLIRDKTLNSSNDCEFTLVFNKRSIDGRDLINFDVKKVNGICCLTYLDVATYFTLPAYVDNGNKFTFSAYYEDVLGRQRKIYGEGYTSYLNIAECSFDAICSTNKIGTDLQNMLSMLTHDFELSVFIDGLVSASEINLNDVPYNYSVTPNLEANLLDYDGSEDNANNNPSAWKWSAVIVDDVLTGTVSAIKDGVTNSFQLILTKDGNNAFAFNDIVKFSGLRYNENSVIPDTELLINARVKNSDGTQSIFTLQLKLNGTTVKLVNCTEPVSVNYAE